MNRQDFYMGNEFRAYEYFGAQVEAEGVTFRTYAPQAKEIWLMGDFNGWQEETMFREGQSGIFTITSSNAKPGMLYKYKIHGADNSYVEHCDPYGFSMEVRPKNASRIVDLSYSFQDAEWMKKRTKNYERPLNIYELHLGSWKKKGTGEEDWYSYDEIAALLIPYLLENGYTHVEFLPLSEHPSDCSWGYQNTGFFSPTSRYGSPTELKKLMDCLHQANIGAILDFVPVHFAIDEYALANYDGTSLYEYPPSDVGHSEWGTYNFNFSRGEIRSFLQSSANYWLEEYHFDGLRMDAVSRAIYWMGDPKRGINTCSLDFICKMNQGLQKINPTAMLIAEDSTDYGKVTAPVACGGLGFDYKWDMGWMNDTLAYFKLSPQERPQQYHKLTFSMFYFYNELFLLPLSHDESVHGKATIVQKMWGNYDEKISQCRALYLYMYLHPGKKLNFMGNEFAQFREWDEKREQDFSLLEYPIHDAFHHFMKDLNHLYQREEAAYTKEYNPDYFKWLEVHGEKDSVYIFQRGKGKNCLIAAFNFSDRGVEDYPVTIDQSKKGQEPVKIQEILNTDWDIYSGKTKKDPVILETKNNILALDIHEFSGRVFRTLE
ncbi:MAG: 1,4-alpha-glucan branching protein GlgB [Acetivibrio sp.]